MFQRASKRTCIKLQCVPSCMLLCHVQWLVPSFRYKVAPVAVYDRRKGSLDRDLLGEGLLVLPHLGLTPFSLTYRREKGELPSSQLQSPSSGWTTASISSILLVRVCVCLCVCLGTHVANVLMWQMSSHMCSSSRSRGLHV